MVPASAGVDRGQEHAAVVRRALHGLRRYDGLRSVRTSFDSAEDDVLTVSIVAS